MGEETECLQGSDPCSHKSASTRLILPSVDLIDLRFPQSMFSSNKSQIGIFLLSLSWLAGSNAEPPFREFVEPNRTSDSGFGDSIVTLATGNVVVTAPLADKSGISDVGAVYLYDGSTGTLISSLTGSSQGDMVGSSQGLRTKTMENVLGGFGPEGGVEAAALALAADGAFHRTAFEHFGR